VTTRSQGHAAPSLFRDALGTKWDTLDPVLRAAHSGPGSDRFSGRADVERGTSVFARLTCWLLGFPPAGDGQPVTVDMTRSGDGEVWTRHFGTATFHSHLTPASRPGHYCERFGPFTYEIAIPVENGAMRLEARRGWFLGVPMPKRCLVTSDSSEFARDGRLHFDVALRAPFGLGLIVRYRGSLDRAREAEAHGSP
jgi:hypothetical protein